MPLDFDTLDPAPPDDRGRVRFREERDIGAVLSTTFAFLRETWRELGLGLLYIAGPILLLTAIASYVFQTRLLGMMGEIEAIERQAPEDPEAMVGLVAQMFGPSYVLTLLGAVVGLLLITAVVYGYVRLYRAGEAGRIAPGALWVETSHLLGRSAMVWLVTGGVVVLCMLGVMLFCLGLVALVALMPALALTMPVALLGGRSAGAAFSDAWQLVRSAWLPTFGVVLVAGLIQVAFSLALSLPANLAVQLMSLNAVAGGTIEPTGAVRVLMAVGTVLGTFGYFFAAIPLVATALQYFSLREREEGGGLSARLDALEESGRAAPPPPPLPEGGVDPGAPPAGPADVPRPGFRGRGFDEEA